MAKRGRGRRSAGFIERHNADPGSSWVAGKTPFSDMSAEDFGAMMGDNPMPTDPDHSTSLTEAWPLQETWERMVAQNTSFPDWFDARHRWQWCPTLFEVRAPRPASAPPLSPASPCPGAQQLALTRGAG